MYVIGILKGNEMTSCKTATSDLKEAKAEAKKEGKNVYEHVNGFYYLKAVFVKNPLEISNITKGAYGNSEFNNFFNVQ